MRRIEICENGLHMVWEITDSNEIKLLHFSALPFFGDGSYIRYGYPVLLSG